MLQAMGNSMSAVRAYARGLLVSAHNVANAGSKSFEPLDTVFLSDASGGVRAEVRKTEQTGVDITKETIDRVAIEHAINANIAVIRASDKTLGALLDITA